MDAHRVHNHEDEQTIQKLDAELDAANNRVRELEARNDELSVESAELMRRQEFTAREVSEALGIDELRSQLDLLTHGFTQMETYRDELRSQLDRALSELVEMRKHSMEAYRIATEFLAEPPNTLDTKALVLICTELEAIDADRKPGEPVPNKLASGKEVPTDTKSVQGGRD